MIIDTILSSDSDHFKIFLLIDDTLELQVQFQKERKTAVKDFIGGSLVRQSVFSATAPRIDALSGLVDLVRNFKAITVTIYGLLLFP